MRTTYIASTSEARNLHLGKQTAIVTIVKPQPTFTNKDEVIKVNTFIEDGNKMRFVAHSVGATTSPLPIKLHYQPGQTIAVREKCYEMGRYKALSIGETGDVEVTFCSEWDYEYGAQRPTKPHRVISPATMPREAIRTHLLVKDVVCVRVQDMTSEQAQSILPDMSNIERMQALHRKFGAGAWDNNVFVFITKIEKQ